MSRFHKEVSTWGSTYQYFDKLDGKNIPWIMPWSARAWGLLDGLFTRAGSTADFQTAIDPTQSELTNLYAMEKNSSDPTPWKQAHSADISLMSQYRLNSGPVIVVPLLEQGMRVYQNGKPLRAFLATTGRYELLTLPGTWNIESPRVGLR